MTILSDKATEIAATYDEKAGIVRRWIMRNPNTMFWASVGAVVLAAWLGAKWVRVTTYLFGA